MTSWSKIEWAFEGWSELFEGVVTEQVAADGKQVWDTDQGLPWRVQIASNFMCNALFNQPPAGVEEKKFVKTTYAIKNKLCVSFDPALEKFVVDKFPSVLE